MNLLFEASRLLLFWVWVMVLIAGLFVLVDIAWRRYKEGYQLTGKRSGGILEEQRKFERKLKEDEAWARGVRDLRGRIIYSGDNFDVKEVWDNGQIKGRVVLMADQRYSYQDTRDNKDQILWHGRAVSAEWEQRREASQLLARIVEEQGREFLAAMHVSSADTVADLLRKEHDYRVWRAHQDKKRAEESKMGNVVTGMFHTETRYGGIEGGVKVAGTKGVYRVYVVDREKARSQPDAAVEEYILVADNSEAARMAALIEQGVAVKDLQGLHVHSELVCQVPLLPVEGNKAPANG